MNSIYKNFLDANCHFKTARLFTVVGLLLSTFTCLFSQTPPVISNLTVSGILQVGDSLTATFDWSDPDEEDTEAVHWYIWYSSTDMYGANLKLLIKDFGIKSIILTAAEEGKYIYVEVGPKSSSPPDGIHVQMSTPFPGPVLPAPVPGGKYPDWE